MGARPAVTLTGLTSPRGIFVSLTTGDIWVADTNGSRALRYPKFNDLAVSSAFNYSIPSPGPLALTQDASGNLYIADASNRVAIRLSGTRGAERRNYIVNRATSPGAFTAIFSLGNANAFGTNTVSATTLPLPTTLGGIQVFLNEQPVPLYAVTPNQIDFVVPMGAPTSGTADLRVERTATGEVLSNSPIQMDRVSPGLFTITQTGSGQAAAINQDGTVNGADHPAPRGSMSLSMAPGKAPCRALRPRWRRANRTCSVGPEPAGDYRDCGGPPENVTYSGSAPNFPGLWQVNVKIPDTVAPTTATNPTQVSNGSEQHSEWRRRFGSARDDVGEVVRVKWPLRSGSNRSFSRRNGFSITKNETLAVAMTTATQPKSWTVTGNRLSSFATGSMIIC